MAQNKTQENDGDVETFLANVENSKRQQDARVVVSMMQEITGCKPKMWGEQIIGFDRYHYKYESGREGDFLITGVSPRKTALSVYIIPGFGAYADLLEKLGKYKNGTSCLNITKLENIDINVLYELIERSVADMRAKYHS